METGLKVIPITQEDLREIHQAIANSNFYTEYNSTYGYYFFPEQSDNLNELEAQLHNILIGSNYRIEGIF